MAAAEAGAAPVAALPDVVVVVEGDDAEVEVGVTIEIETPEEVETTANVLLFSELPEEESATDMEESLSTGISLEVEATIVSLVEVEGAGVIVLVIAGCEGVTVGASLSEVGVAVGVELPAHPGR